MAVGLKQNRTSCTTRKRTDCCTAVGHLCRGSHRRMLDCRLAVGRIGASGASDQRKVLWDRGSVKVGRAFAADR